MIFQNYEKLQNGRSMAETAETDIRHVGLRISLAQGGKSANGDRGDRLAHYTIMRK